MTKQRTNTTPTPPLCARCAQPFPLIHLSVYAHGQFCPPCDRAEMAERATVADLLAQADADNAALAESEASR